MSKARNLSNTIRVDDAVTLPSGDTASRPAGAVAGSQRFNTDTGSIEFYDGTSWISTNLIPSVDSVTGTIYAGVASTLTIGVSNATDTITVRFSEGGSTIADVEDVAVSAGSASVAVPSAVYGQTAGDTIAVSVINSDGTPSSNAITKTVQGLPTGGTITTSGGYRIHTFTSSSSLVVPSGFSTDVEYLVIAGGAGGGYRHGGGGGAGGYRTATGFAVSPTSYTVTVGAGGAGGTSGVVGGNGGNSVFSTITSTGGGGGASSDTGTSVGSSGGSGGGGRASSSGGAGTSGQGTTGGTGGNNSGGGGGGATQAGGTSATNIGGPGGNGTASSITGSSVTRAGGGGGGANDSGGTGGTGGGGNGKGNNGTGDAGTVNTGSGGGGGGGDVGGPGGAGGSGIVIVRYQI